MKGLLTVSTGALMMLLAFQNCQKINFTEAKSLNSAQEVICDPFSSTSSDACSAGSGLIGNIYYRPTNASWSVNSSAVLIQRGTKVSQTLQLSQVNIPERSFRDGFPLSSGGKVQNDINEDLIEWFAIDMIGFIRIDNPSQAGTYQLALVSDDGAALRINNQDFIMNDTIHATTWDCSTQTVNFATGIKQDISLRYFQGPREHITLQMMWRPVSLSHLPCGPNGGEWQPIPANVIFHE